MKNVYKTVFIDEWPYWIGGMGLAVIAVFLWCSGQPWGVIGGYRNWGDWVFYGIGLYENTPVRPLLSTKSCMAGGLILGSFSAALLSREFGLRMPTWWELGKGFWGGALMGIGAVLTGGCNVGGFYSNIAALSLSGILMWAGLLIGAILGIKYLAWEMEAVPMEIMGRGITIKPAGPTWKSMQPLLGFVLLLAAFFFPLLYAKHYYTKIGIILLLGVLSGFVMNRSRFCFAAAFRDPFMVGQGAKVRSMFLSLLIYTIGVSILKWRGFVPENWYVFSTAGWGAVVGGVMFGFGMIAAGGCGTGTLFRVGEGQIKLMAALVSMAATNSLTKHYLHLKFGERIFLPDLLGSWTAALLLVFAIMFFWFWFATWNEEKQKFVLF
jgi:uncharacterized membrane protein YedE/YeeE